MVLRETEETKSKYNAFCNISVSTKSYFIVIDKMLRNPLFMNPVTKTMTNSMSPLTFKYNLKKHFTG